MGAVLSNVYFSPLKSHRKHNETQETQRHSVEQAPVDLDPKAHRDPHDLRVRDLYLYALLDTDSVSYIWLSYYHPGFTPIAILVLSIVVVMSDAR